MQLPPPPTRFNRRIASPVQPLWAGVLPPWAILTHVSRKSGKRCRIPILPAAVIAAWLGHSDNAFTMRTYVHSQDGALVAAATALQAVVTNRDNSGSTGENEKRRPAPQEAG